MSSHHFVTVCVVCVLCAAHTPCSAHTDVAPVSAKTPWTSPEGAEVVPSLWRVERSSGSPDSTGGSRVDDEDDDEPAAILASVRRVRETRKPAPKKYVRSYSEEKATRLAARVDGNRRVETRPKRDDFRRLELLARLGQNPEAENRPGESAAERKRRDRRHSPDVDEKYFTKKLFDAYGDGESLSIEGFERLLKKLGLFRLVENIERLDADREPDNRANGSRDGPTEESSLDPNGISSQQRCLNSRELLNSVTRDASHATKTTNRSEGGNLPDWLFTRVCPVLIYHLAGNTSAEREGCVVPLNAYSPAMKGAIDELVRAERNMEAEENTRNVVQVWVYSTISIVIISLCGLLGVLVIPVMGKSYYHQLLQFLVALAIGTLCGDALIHLLPHAMMAPHSHSHELSTIIKTELDVEAEHNLNMWKGLTAMLGLITFFFAEKALAMIAEWRKHRQRKNKLPTRVRVMRETDGANSNNVGEKLCKHKYSSYPYCYGEITTETRDNHHDRNQHNDHERAAPIDEEKPLTSSCNSCVVVATAEKIIIPDRDDLESAKDALKTGDNDWRLDGDASPLNAANDRNRKHQNHQHRHSHREKNRLNHESSGGENAEVAANETESYTVIIREHENKHHGHTHSHGHVHAAPDSMSSVAWMVVMGDGLHNFTDGMAIGAAFAANVAGGFSTAIAVFCHELPHELGDFAVLLKAGMSWRQALFYNLLSSVLCLFGMIIGVLLGATPTATSWIFAAAAGMFIYIALVDMIPELSSSHSEEGGSRWECVLQALGLITGLGIMLIIALYEHDLKHIFSD